jgi:polyisoprenoid-binding protein YceI
MKKTIALLLIVFALISVQGAFAGQWNVDKAHTAVKFKVKHLLTNVWGEFTDYTAELEYDPANPTASTIKVVIDISSIDTGNEKRDQHLLSADFFNAAEFPTMTFISKEIKPMGNNKLKAKGNLTIRGETHMIELMVDGPSDPLDFMGTIKVGASAEAKINRTEWGLTWNRTLETGNLVVGEDVTIVIDAELDKVN